MSFLNNTSPLAYTERAFIERIFEFETWKWSYFYWALFQEGELAYCSSTEIVLTIITNVTSLSIFFFFWQFFLQFHFRLTPGQIQQQQQKRGGNQPGGPPGLAPPPPRNIPSANPLNPFAQR